MMDRDGCSSVDGSARLGSARISRTGSADRRSLGQWGIGATAVRRSLMTEEVELITTWVVVGWVTGDTDKRFFM